MLKFGRSAVEAERRTEFLAAELTLTEAFQSIV